MMVLANEQIKRIIEGAFSPMKCVAQIWDYSYKIRFKVFDSEGNSVVEMPELVLDNIRDKAHLHEVLCSVREGVQRKGFVLDEWP